jgi:hypothetical protein
LRGANPPLHKQSKLDEIPGRRYLRRMTQFFDMDDRARLPWRFFGATMTVLARL